MGSMGMPMARNLVKNGFVVNGFDVMETTLTQCKNFGINPMSSIQEACNDVDYVVTSLPKTNHVEEAILGQDGVIDSCRPGTCIIDVSTITPMLAQ